MANQAKPVGLRPHGRILRVQPFVAGSTVYPGDAVALASDGQVDTVATGKLLGAAANYATVGQVVQVLCDPNQLFEIESDTAIAVTDIGLNCTLAGSANTTYKRSGQTIEASTINTTLTLSLQILAISTEVGNAANAVNNDVIVRINAHQLGAIGQTGV